MIRPVRLVCATLLALPTLLLAGGADDAARQPAAAKVAGPAFKVDPSWPLEMPNNWILGAVTGVFVDARDHVWVTHLPETLTEEETSADAEAADRAPAARPRRPSSNSIRTGTSSRAGAMRPHDIAVYPRNPHGIFVDHNNFVWIGTYMHHRVMKFTREGKHRDDDRHLRQERRQQRHDAARRPGGHLGRSEDQRSVHRRRLPQSARDRVRRRDRQVPAPLGRLRRSRPTTRRSRPTIPRGRTSSSPPCTASPGRRTA